MIYINIRPLLDTNFTGIPQLTWHVVRYWLGQAESKVRFFLGIMEVDRDFVETLVRHRTGRYLSAVRDHHYGAFKPIGREDASRSVALFSHTRELREKYFGREVQIFHDLTGLLTPEFHPGDVVGWETRRMVNDTAQIDCFVCVSHASRDDLVRYFRVESDRTVVAHPGVAWFADHRSVYESMSQFRFEDYVLILGTFEPRKNIELVFQYIVSNPAILDRYIFCFCGPEGWGGVYQRSTSDPRISKYVENGRIRITPFVNERVKYSLIKEASFLIYPSYMEGFGSPLAEALSLGVPAVVSYGGSLPEVAGEAGYYFDPLSVEGLAGAIRRLMADLERDNAQTRLRAFRQGRQFTWEGFNQKVHAVLDRVGRASGMSS